MAPPLLARLGPPSGQDGGWRKRTAADLAGFVDFVGEGIFPRLEQAEILDCAVFPQDWVRFTALCFAPAHNLAVVVDVQRPAVPAQRWQLDDLAAFPQHSTLSIRHLRVPCVVAPRTSPSRATCLDPGKAHPHLANPKPTAPCQGRSPFYPPNASDAPKSDF